MPRIRLKYFAAALLLFLLAIPVTLYLAADPLLNAVVRPLVEKALAWQIGGTAAIGRISAGGGVIAVREVRLAGEGMNLDLSSASVTLRPMDALRGRIEELHLVSPRLSVTPASRGGGGEIPARLPVTVERVLLADGVVEIALGERRILLDRLSLEGGGASPYPLAISGRLGGEGGAPFSVSGVGSWAEGPSLTLNSLLWEEREMLASPLQVSLPAGGDALAKVAIDLPRLDLPLISRWAALLGEEFPAPGGVDVTLESPRAELSMEGGSLAARVNWRAGRFGMDEWRLPLQDSEFFVEVTDKGWKGRGDLGAGGSVWPLSASGALPFGTLNGTFGRKGGMSVDFAGGLDHLHATVSSLGIPDVEALFGKKALPAWLEAAQGGEGEFDLFREGEKWRGTGRGSLRALQFSGGGAGPLSAAGSFTWRDGAFALQFDSLEVEGGEYLTEDGLSGFGGGSLRMKGRLSGSAERVNLAFQAEPRIGEFLHGPLYADLSALRGKVEVEGVFEPGRQRVRFERLRLSLRDGAAVDLRGEVSPDRIDMAGRLAVADLGRGVTELLHALAGEAYPALRDLRPGGALSADLALEYAPQGWKAAGEVRPSSLSLRWGTDVEVTQVSGNVPFLLFGGGRSPTPEPTRSGRLELASAQLGPARLRDAELAISSSANRWSFTPELQFSLAGGVLEVGPAEVALADPDVQAQVRVRVEEVDLAQLDEWIGLPDISGSVSADLGVLRYQGGRLTTDGEAIVSVFGGTVRVSNLSAEHLFSANPVTRADVDFSGLDLGRLTSTFAFGEMQGVIDGHVHSLRLFGALPTRFEAVMETRTEGKRNISVHALNNLSILSQGGISSILSRGVYRFIDFYRYRRIGVHCTLDNDRFRLTGTARPDSGDYLVYGGIIPPKIDIIAPRGAISFREMLKRVGRIERTGG